MYCITCGHFVLDGYKFCSHCGSSTSTCMSPTAEVRIESPSQTNAVIEPFSYNYEEIPLPEPPPIYTPAEVTEPSPAKPKKEKYFFGKGALMFCLTIIAILSVTAGMFMGLYFDAI